MTRVVLIGMALALTPAFCGAQVVSVGGQYAFSEYHEVSSTLNYRGGGPSGRATLAVSKLVVDGGVVRLSFDPIGARVGAAFHTLEIDARARWFLASGIFVGVGIMRWTSNPEFAAQTIGAVRVGGGSRYLIGPGAEITFRADYLAGARFSGGGRSPFGIGLGLNVNVGSPNGRLRVTADYGFDRFDRHTNPAGAGTVKVPIQQSLARLGLAVGM